MSRPARDSRGYAIIVALIVTAITAALVLGFITSVNTEQKIAQNDTDYSGAFYAAEAGLEKLNADLSKLFATKVFPSQADIQAIMDPTRYPVIAHVTFQDYSAFGGHSAKLNGALTSSATTVTVDSAAGWPTAGFFMIDAEEFSYTGTTATTFTGVSRGQTGSNPAAHAHNASVTRSRVLTLTEGAYSGLTAQIVPFTLDVTAQAGVGTEAKLTREVQAALIPVFQFGMFSDSDLAFFAGPNFTFNGRIHTNGNLFLTQFAGATLTLTDRVTAFKEVIRGLMPNSEPGFAGTVVLKSGTSSSRALAVGEASYDTSVGGLPPSAYPSAAHWAGWTNLSLTTYNAFLRNGLTGARSLNLPFVAAGYGNIELIRRPPAGEAVDSVMGESRLANQASVRAFISDSAASIPGGVGYALNNSLAGYTGTPFAEANPNDPDFVTAAGADETSNTSLIDGYIYIERRNYDGTWTDVTMEILGLGIATDAPNAILRLQKPRWDRLGSAATDYVPINMFDTQEGRFRNAADSLSTTTQIRKLGIMNVVELDVARLRDWLAGSIGSLGTATVSNNGYIFYFSDRRGNRDGSGAETGELGFEDFVNPADNQGDPDGALNAGEDLNGDGALQNYGANLPYSPYTAATDLYTTGVPVNGGQRPIYITEPLDNSETSFDVVSVAGLATGFYRIDTEIVDCTAVATSPITCSRGQLGSTAAAHAMGVLSPLQIQKGIALTEDLNTTETAFDVASTTGMTPGYYRVNNEIVNCTAVASSPITCTRAQLGTSAANHLPASAIDLSVDVTSTTATDFTVSADTNVAVPGYFRIGNEIVRCASKASNVLTCQRGQMATAPATHTKVANWVTTNLTNATTTINVVSGAAFPTAGAWYRLENNETAYCTRATNTLTCTRGQLNTTAVAHPLVGNTLNGIHNATTTSINLTSAAAFTTFPVTLRVDSEVILCNSKVGNTLTCVRGQEGTTAASHTSGAAVQTRIDIRLVNMLPVNLMTSERASKNRVHYFRRAIRLVNGGGTNLPLPGFTVASENIVYVLGNYNSDGTANFADNHSHAAVMGDVVTLLSNAYTNGGDERSFMYSHNRTLRLAQTTWYRTAIASGKGINFVKPSAEPDIYFGTDGGAHNFLRYLEDWTWPNSTLTQTSNYLGSIVSLYYMKQAVGPFKCCSSVYSPPQRAYGFDLEFLVPSQLPPGTPRFRDINNLSFRQTIRAD